jgi:5'-nucleotidase
VNREMRPLILVSNDDGIAAEGLRVLVEAMKKIGNVAVVAPAQERSAVGHAITLHSPLRVRSHAFGEGVVAWSINGMPADCIKIAVSSLLPVKPDLVVSGINVGANMGMDILYSGTISAATEAVILGMKAFAISVEEKIENDFIPAMKTATLVAKALLRHSLSSETVLNVNVPGGGIEEIRGILITSQSSARFSETYEERKDPRNESYYWLTGTPASSSNEVGTDVDAVNRGYISITPLSLLLTHIESIKRVRQWNLTF